MRFQLLKKHLIWKHVRHNPYFLTLKPVCAKNNISIRYNNFPGMSPEVVMTEQETSMSGINLNDESDEYEHNKEDQFEEKIEEANDNSQRYFSITIFIFMLFSI